MICFMKEKITMLKKVLYNTKHLKNLHIIGTNMISNCKVQVLVQIMEPIKNKIRCKELIQEIL